MKKNFSAAAAFMMIMGMCVSASAAFDENLNNYTLDTIVVESDATTNKFGDTITEQSYYRTGGDVKVITREEIEKRHYTDLSEAIKRIPGVSFQNPGFRGGEYGFGSQYNNGVEINGDTRVLILVDGRRVDNSASARVSSTSISGGKGTGVILDQVVNMENVDKIEVIKGPGASAYGADALGGVINIITRKGASDNQGSIDLATGSWKKHVYSLNYSGSAGKDKSWHYFVSANRNQAQESKYKYGPTGDTGTLPGSQYKEEGVNLRIDKDFNDKQNLKIWYNFMQGADGYPVTAPATNLWNEKDYKRIMFAYLIGELDENNKWVRKLSAGDANIPGYRTIYNTRALYNMTNNFKHNDLDVTYTFDKDNGMDSFIRLYNQNHRYFSRGSQQFAVWGSSQNAAKYTDIYPDGATDEQLWAWMQDNLAPFPGTATKEQIEAWTSKYGNPKGVNTIHDEKNRGAQLQYAKSVGVNDIIASVTYDKAKHYNISVSKNTKSVVERDSIETYIQDKIHVSDKFDITPAIRYSKYSAHKTTAADGTVSENSGNVHSFTPMISAQYMFDDTSSFYAGWTKVYRPLRPGDYDYAGSSTTKILTKLQDEKGDAWTFGARKELSDNTTVAAHYDFTRMSSAVATLPIWDDVAQEFSNTAVNAKETKKSFNVTLDHKFNDNFNVGFAYSHSKDNWKAKDGWILDPDWGYKNVDDVNTAINKLRPQNHYTLNMSYEKGKLYTGLLTNLYSGCNTNAFSDKRFLVLDFNLNYKVNKDMTAYFVVNNLTNEGYETVYKARNGIGAGAMPGRCYMVGLKYKF